MLGVPSPWISGALSPVTGNKDELEDRMERSPLIFYYVRSVPLLNQHFIVNCGEEMSENKTKVKGRQHHQISSVKADFLHLCPQSMQKGNRCKNLSRTPLLPPGRTRSDTNPCVLSTDANTDLSSMAGMSLSSTPVVSSLTKLPFSEKAKKNHSASLGNLPS